MLPRKLQEDNNDAHVSPRTSPPIDFPPHSSLDESLLLLLLMHPSHLQPEGGDWVTLSDSLKSTMVRKKNLASGTKHLARARAWINRCDPIMFPASRAHHPSNQPASPDQSILFFFFLFLSVCLICDSHTTACTTMTENTKQRLGELRRHMRLRDALQRGLEDGCPCPRPRRWRGHHNVVRSSRRRGGV